jgi:hypothetical protein
MLTEDSQNQRGQASQEYANESFSEWRRKSAILTASETINKADTPAGVIWNNEVVYHNRIFKNKYGMMIGKNANASELGIKIGRIEETTIDDIDLTLFFS